MMDARVLLVLGVLLLSGCVGGSNQPAPTTGASLPPPPLQAFKKEIKSCAPGDPNQPVQTTAVEGRFEVRPGYDEIIVAYHESGSGARVSAEIRWIEESNQVVWSKAAHEVNTLPATTCGGHGSHGSDGEVKKVEAGNFTVKINYSGTVGLHLEVTARSSRAAANMTDHMHLAVP